MEQNVEEKSDIKNIKKLDIIVWFVLMSIVLIALAYMNGILIDTNVFQQSTIENVQKQQNVVQTYFRKLNPLQIVKNYQESQKIKRQQIFVQVIEKLQPKLSPNLSTMISSTLLTECDKKNIDENLVLALIYVESSIDPMKESYMGACGLMQVRYKIWKEEPELKDNGVDKWHKLFWPEENIKAGTDIFKKFYEESGNNINITLYRYNSGSPKIPEKPNEDVLKYINKIMYYHYYIMNHVRGNNEASKGFNR